MTGSRSTAAARLNGGRSLYAADARQTSSPSKVEPMPASVSSFSGRTRKPFRKGAAGMTSPCSERKAGQPFPTPTRRPSDLTPRSGPSPMPLDKEQLIQNNTKEELEQKLEKAQKELEKKVSA